MAGLSKRMSYVLRHHPESVGLTLDGAGWVELASFAQALGVSRAAVEAVVRSSDKQRFIIEGDRIRANQGHSIDVDLGYEPSAPPDRLYHGTVARFVSSIREHGLLRGERHHVHLSADRATAINVGGRRGKPVILVIDARAMADADHSFLVTPNGVWLTEHVPVVFIEFPQV